MSHAKTILCLASYEKGQVFLRQAKQLGWRVILLTSKSLEHGDWPRASIDEIFYIPDTDKQWNRQDVLLGVSFMARHHRLDCIVALDDFDVETAAALREHLRVPGMGETTARYFRDKLAMRVRARDDGIAVPDFCHVLNYDELRDFLGRVPGPWILKPRFQASSLGLKKVRQAGDLWPILDALGDQQSFYVLERFIDGAVYHVDSVIAEREVVFAIAARYGAPPMAVVHDGGIFSTQILEYGAPEEQALLEANRQVLRAMGHLRGVSHTEFIRAADGTFHFLETSARVGGANIMDLIEAATGLNLWAEWAKVELLGAAYRPEPLRREYAGLLVSLARQEWPDAGVFHEPEVAWRMRKRHHVGVVVRSPDRARIDALLTDYIARVQRDFHASQPPPERAID